MSKPRKLLLTCATHLAGLALGWQGWNLLHPSAGTTNNAPAALSQKREDTSTAMSAEDVFAFVEAKGSLTDAQQTDASSQAEFARLLTTMEVPADIEAALTAELTEWLKDGPGDRKPSPKIMALMYHWAARDMAAMQRWTESGAGPQDAYFYHSLQVFDKLAKDKGPEALAGGLTGKFGTLTAHGVAVGLGYYADMDRALALKGTLTPQQWEMVRHRCAATWPMRRKDDILKLAITENSPDFLLEFVKRRGTEGTQWLSQAFANGSIDDSFAGQLTKSSLWEEFAKDGSILPLDERAEHLRATGNPNRDVMGEIAKSDVNQLLRSGRDWRYAFRHGEADAEQVLAEISNSLPELASKAPDALRSQLYMELVEEDPARAAALLEGLPAEQRSQIASQATRTAFANVDPNDFLTALQQVPSDTPELWDTRLQAWNHKSQLNYRRLSDDYVTWVRQLPPGLDREMAMYSLALAANHLDSGIAAEMRAGITDPALKQKLTGSH